MDCLMGHWIELRPFEDADVDAAAQLLRERHERHRAAEPLLAPAEDARAQVARGADGSDGSRGCTHSGDVGLERDRPATR